MNKWNADFPDDVIYDVAVLTHEVAAAQVVVGMTMGGNNFRPNPTFRNPEFDGKRHRVAGLTRPINWDSEFAGTLVQFPSALVAKFMPGSTSVVAGLVTTVTPAGAGAPIAVASLLVKPRLTFARGNGGTLAVEFDYGFVETFDINGQDKDEAKIAYVIKAEVDPAAVGYSTDNPPFRLIITDPA